MSDRSDAVHIVRELHGARVRGDLASLCALFAAEGRFEIAGASVDKPITIAADGIAAFRPWLSMMVKAFRINDYTLLSLIVEGSKCVAHWQANIHSKVTGIETHTELVDLLDVRDGRIVAYKEFFVPR